MSLSFNTIGHPTKIDCKSAKVPVECAARVTDTYTDRQMLLSSYGIPTPIRNLFSVPPRPEVVTQGGKESTGLNSFSHCIRAANGGYWLVSPCSSSYFDTADPDYDLKTALQMRTSVAYYPDKTSTRPICMSDFQPISVWNGYNKTPAQAVLERFKPYEHHPYDSGYVSITCNVGRSKNLGDFEKEFNGGQKLEFPETVEVLCCAGGIVRRKVGNDIRWEPDFAIRLIYPTPQYRGVKGDNKYILSAENELHEVIYFPINTWFSNYHLVCGATLTADGNNVYAVGGVGCKINGSNNPWIIDDPSATTDYTFGQSGKTGLRVQKYTIEFEAGVIEYYPHGSSEKEQCACLVPTITINEYESAGRSPLCAYTNVALDNDFLNRNAAPFMFPRVFSFGDQFVAYGGKGIAGTHPLREKLKAQRATVYKGSYTCLIPLVNNEYVLRTSAQTHVIRPLNLFGDAGMLEGAAPIPFPRELVFLGGVDANRSWTYGFTDYQTKEVKKGNAYDLKPDAGAVEGTTCVFDITLDDNAINKLSTQLYSRIINISNHNLDEPYSLGIDTLTYDCWYTDVHQLGTTDYFILPTSVLAPRYQTAPPYTLIKRVVSEPSESDLENLDETAKLYLSNRRVVVGEVANSHVLPQSFCVGTPSYLSPNTIIGEQTHSAGVYQETDTVFWYYRIGCPDDTFLVQRIEIVDAIGPYITNQTAGDISSNSMYGMNMVTFRDRTGELPKTPEET